MSKINPAQSIAYQIESMQHRNRIGLAREYELVLMALHGEQLMSGERSIRDYSHMTMRDASIELRMRTRVYRARTNAKIRKYREKNRAKQRAQLEALAQGVTKQHK